ncbi:hypothetical protein NEFER03_1388 [Nematocida sp. LUAm3]|nr:hypothetical protein NEFER03_1388 [Nematocida sp. LUAm3]KAI5174782.1 hypothetical protein NEFER02_0892 [Nematocida sp. LUAm2]KAI5177807.1 hypothetical protein NEFER01_1009 [Nematocida sp. LUAm1]
MAEAAQKTKAETKTAEDKFNKSSKGAKIGMIIGAVVVGILIIALTGYAIHYFRSDRPAANLASKSNLLPESRSSLAASGGSADDSSVLKNSSKHPSENNKKGSGKEKRKNQMKDQKTDDSMKSTLMEHAATGLMGNLRDVRLINLNSDLLEAKQETA